MSAAKGARNLTASPLQWVAQPCARLPFSFTTPLWSVIDGDMKVSQTPAVVTYIGAPRSDNSPVLLAVAGKKVGLCEGVCEFKAMQYMLDAEDVWTEYGKVPVQHLGQHHNDDGIVAC